MAGYRLGVRNDRRDPAAEAQKACDALLGAAPVAPERLDEHLQCLLEADSQYPEDGRIYARIARALHARAVAWPDPVRDDLQSARSWALRCLALRAEVAGRLEATGGRIDAHVVERVPAEDAACLAWAAISWSRWLQGRGVAGAAIDLGAVAALGARAVEVGAELDRGRAWEAQGLALGIVPAALGRDEAAAAAALAEARQHAPDRLSTAVDTATLVYGPSGQEETWRHTLQAVVAARGAGEGMQAVEDAAAQARARALLEAGPSAPSRW